MDHGGGINGFVTHMMHLPKDDLTVMLLFNTEGPGSAHQLAEKLARLAVGIPR
ncbi:hypothetical protein ATI61_11887 [Archangium gephyra]|uniref:Beta-lactamase n=1 Tax=Archangium gephyra TaxID=48 RepID=A0AAC8Q9F0_9BACT|nr:hypothetical protein [Archangium gephyra]AKJ03245.1 Hypothetical protein AA314_04871 [Archangium gephyra]REG22882.1 hypothetical protein ATI61_11887 [Archangium gephyra]